MNTILFVTGDVGAGKSTFIEKNFAGRDGYFVFDLEKICMNLFGTVEAFEDDRLACIYNQATNLAMDALMDGMILVVEYCLTDAYDDDFVSLVKYAKQNGSRIELVQMTTDQAKIAQRLGHSSARLEMKSSRHIRNHLIEILNGIVECLGINNEMETVLQLAWEGGSVSLCKFMEDSVEHYFYVSNEITLFDFLEEGGSENFPGIDQVYKFDSFDKALKDLDSNFDIYSLYPVKIHEDYLKQFKSYYLKHLKIGNHPFDKPVWQKFLN